MSKARVKLRAKGNAAKKSALREKQKKSSDALQLNMDDEEYQNFVVSTSLKLNLTEVEVEEAVKQLKEANLLSLTQINPKG